MFELILIFMGTVTFAFFVEVVRFPNESFLGLCSRLRADIASIYNAFCSTPVIRHVFDITLCNDLRLIVHPYAKKGFDIILFNNLDNGVPFVGIQFVPAHLLEESELQELAQFVKLKFREYLNFYGLGWSNFVTYTVGADYANFYIYYAEYGSDFLYFRSLYHAVVRKATGNTNSGILIDAELEEELKDVD